MSAAVISVPPALIDMAPHLSNVHLIGAGASSEVTGGVHQTMPTTLICLEVRVSVGAKVTRSAELTSMSRIFATGWTAGILEDP
jgi:hypothetical protein